jgi:hypothetical protein
MMMTDPDDTRPCARFFASFPAPGQAAGPAQPAGWQYRSSPAPMKMPTPLAFEIERLASTLAVVAPGDGF